MDEIGKKVAILLRSSLKLESTSADMFRLFVESGGGESCRELANLDPILPEDVLYFKALRQLKPFLGSFCRMLRVFQYQPKLRAKVSALFRSGFHVTLSALPSRGVKFSIQLGVPHLTLPALQFVSGGGKARASLTRLFRSVMEEASLYHSGKVTPLSPPKGFPPQGVPAPFACRVDLSQSWGLLHPIKGTQGEVIVQLVDFSDTPITTPPSVNCQLDVKVWHIGSRQCVAVATSSGDPTPHQPTSRNLLVTEGSSGTFKIEWTPEESGVHLVSLRINHEPISSSPFRAIVAESGSHRVNLDPGSCGSRQTSTDHPITFVARHIQHDRCDISDSPPIRLFNKKPLPIPALVRTPKFQSREEFIRQLEMEGGRVHHISMCSAYGGAASRKWLHPPNGHVLIHITRDSDEVDDSLGPTKPVRFQQFKVQATPLGNGSFRVSLLLTVTGSYSVFASCARCNAVLEILWRRGGRGIHPTSLYVVPGRLSLSESVVELVKPSKRRRKSRKGKTLLPLPHQRKRTLNPALK